MLYLYNSLSNKKDLFVPLNTNHITMYVCGPTVYDYIHLGNARPIVVFDVLYRLLSYLYPKVTYVRNITDIDDKIIERAKTQGIPVDKLAYENTTYFHEDIKQLNTVSPSFEPKATEYINNIIETIEKLIKRKHAYILNNHVYFDVLSYKEYGLLSGIKNKDLLNNRDIVKQTKQNSNDFVLWKPSLNSNNIGWESPWGYGRPGWHIECSAMARYFLGEQFDIHGGGKDLIFPHHENEIAQSVCSSSQNNIMANYWIHNDFVTVEGNKMSKSLGNFITLREALKSNHGETIRLSILKTHYRQPVDLSKNNLSSSKVMLDKLYNMIDKIKHIDLIADYKKPSKEFIKALCNDLNTHLAINLLYKHVDEYMDRFDEKKKAQVIAEANMLGLLYDDPKNWFENKKNSLDLPLHEIEMLIEQRNISRANKDFKTSDKIREQLKNMGIIIQDSENGTKWYVE